MPRSDSGLGPFYFAISSDVPRAEPRSNSGLGPPYSSFEKFEKQNTNKYQAPAANDSEDPEASTREVGKAAAALGRFVAKPSLLHTLGSANSSASNPDH